MGLYEEEKKRILTNLGFSQSQTDTFSMDDLINFAYPLDTHYKIRFVRIEEGIIGYNTIKTFFGLKQTKIRGVVFVFRFENAGDILDDFIEVLNRYKLPHYYARSHFGMYFEDLHFNIPADQINKIGKQLFEEIKDAYDKHQSYEEEQSRKADEQACRNLRKIVEGE